MKNLLIIGASSDIAQACATEFASRGYNLILAGRNQETLIQAKRNLLNEYSIEVQVESFEALAYEEHDSLFQRSVAAFGSLDGLLIAHGVLIDQQESEQSWEIAQKMIEVNFTSTVSILQIAANYFEQQKKGFICCISSVAGDRGRQSNYLYGAVKSGLSTYLQGLRNRLNKENIHVMTIKPGFVATKMTARMKNLFLVAQPSQIARSIYQALQMKRNTVYLPWFWRPIMCIIRLIPEFIFKRMNL